MAKRIPQDHERGLRIAELIEDGGWQISDLAKEVGVDRKRIYAWRDGGPMHSSSLGSLATVLGTTRSYLLTGQGPISPTTSTEGAAAAILEAILEVRADQVAMQNDLAKLTLEIQGLREDLRSSREPGARDRGARG